MYGHRYHTPYNTTRIQRSILIRNLRWLEAQSIFDATAYDETLEELDALRRGRV